MKKKICALLAIGTIALQSITGFAAADKIVINGTVAEIPADMGSIVEKDDRTCVPIRFVSEYLNCDVSYDDEDRTATIRDKETKLAYVLKDDSEYIYIFPDKSGLPTRILMDTKIFINNEEGRMYAPIRFLAEAMSYNVGWDEVTQTVTLDKIVEAESVAE